MARDHSKDDFVTDRMAEAKQALESARAAEGRGDHQGAENSRRYSDICLDRAMTWALPEPK